MNTSLKVYNFKISYGAADNRLKDFYIPALCSSLQYDRSAGFFSSSALAVAAAGVARLIQNNGRMRLLVGAQLNEEDVAAIQKGHDLAQHLDEKMPVMLSDPEDKLMKMRLEALAWMVATGTLEIKVVLPTDQQGNPLPASMSHDYYHPKEGVFTDVEGNQVAFSGSINESEQGWRNNFEQFMVFCSWQEGHYPFLRAVVHRFERLWHGKEEGWISLQIPEAVRKRLLEFRPDHAPKVDPLETVEPVKEETTSLSNDECERIIFQFIKDAPYFPGAQHLGERTCTVRPWPHQQLVANAIVERFPERFLLCDEVGLGKTIEAGLALRQLVISGRVKRCLLLVPKSVARQWQEEIYEKFVLNIPFFDGIGFSDVFRNPLPIKTDNPWDSYPIILASSQLVKRKDRQPELLGAEPWDLILVDEAHHARRKDFLQPIYRPNRLMELLQGVRGRSGLKDRTKGLLLLTATPMQIHPIEVWDLLRLLGVGGKWGAVEENFLRFFSELRKAMFDFLNADWDFVLTMVNDFLKTGGEIDHVFAEQAEKKLGLVDSQRLRDLPFSGKRYETINQLTTEGRALLIEMAKRHTPLKRFLFRYTRSFLREYQKRGFLKERIPLRKPLPVWIEPTEAEQELYERIEEYIIDFYQKYEAERTGLGFIMTVYRRRLTSSFFAMQQSLERRLKFLRGETVELGLDDDDLEQDDLQQDVTEEFSKIDRNLFREEISYVEDFLSDLRILGGDSKTERLLRDLSEILSQRETVLIFTQYTDTMDYLRDRLKEVYGSQVACYSGRGGEYWEDGTWVLTTKERIKTMFRKGEDIKILLCTEAASEGLNLQTCGVLINYDMPWNPMRVEQRIGRIDRIGQVHDVVWVRNYFYNGTVEAEIYRRLSDRINWFEDVVGELQPILSHVARTIQGIAMTKKSERTFRLEEEIKSLRQELEERQAAGLNIDEYVGAEWSPDKTVVPPIDLQELEDLMVKSSTFGHLFTVHPKIKEAYALEWKGEKLVVTFNPTVFDQYPNSIRLLSFGDDLLNELLSEAETPSTDLRQGPLARFIVEKPMKLVSYYSLINEEIRLIGRITDLQAVLNQIPPPKWTETERSAMEEDFLQVIERIRRQIGEADKARMQAERLALMEEARQLLLKVAYIELALSQQEGLFTETPGLDFSPDATARLKRHGYPFAGMLKLVNVDELQLSPTDPYFQKVQGQSTDSLRGRFNALREQVKELLARLA